MVETNGIFLRNRGIVICCSENEWGILPLGVCTVYEGESGRGIDDAEEGRNGDVSVLRKLHVSWYMCSVLFMGEG